MNATTESMLTQCQAFPGSSSRNRVGIASRIARTVGIWRNRVNDRRAFANLDYRDLRDLGVSQWEIERELAKPFWKG
jgi:uncharacterized protein YjiS (DUF1127 family)